MNTSDDSLVTSALISALNAATRLMIAKAIYQEKSNKLDHRS